MTVRFAGAPLEMSEAVILLHGLWMWDWTLHALHQRLADAGFTVDDFAYASLGESPEAAAGRLRQRMQAVGASRVHVVGHSLGGLIALQALQSPDDLPPGRVVCLGSPLCGNAVAKRIRTWPGGDHWLGQAAELLEHGVEPWSNGREVGVIAGRMPLGFGALLGVFDEAHDGTVAVAETRLSGIRDHQIVSASHSGLVFSAEAARFTIEFLRHGRFRSLVS